VLRRPFWPRRSARWFLRLCSASGGYMNARSSKGCGWKKRFALAA
jgi:hypothetical protein